VTLAGTATLPASPETGTLAVDQATGRTSYSVGSQLHSFTRRAVAGRAPGGETAPHQLGAAVSAMTYDATGALVGLDRGALVRRVGGRLVRTTITGVTSHDLRALAVWPGSPLIYTFDHDAEQVLGIDAPGRVARSLDTSSMDLRNVTGLVVAPSANQTDSPSVQHLYVADAGDQSVLGRIVEASFESSTVVAASGVSGSLVNTLDTSTFSPPSPDRPGLAFLPSADRLFIADGEVDEMGIFEGKNLFATTRAGSLTDTGVSQPWSNEPVGVGYNPANNHLFVSDDDQKEVFELVGGADGRFGTSDDVITHFDTAGVGNTDPEGIDYDTATQSLWAVDGINAQVYRYRAGTDGKVGTSDDIRSNFDVGVYGARDPEGLAYDSARDDPHRRPGLPGDLRAGQVGGPAEHDQHRRLRSRPGSRSRGRSRLVEPDPAQLLRSRAGARQRLPPDRERREDPRVLRHPAAPRLREPAPARRQRTRPDGRAARLGAARQNGQ
jgi:hypothetical protein